MEWNSAEQLLASLGEVLDRGDAAGAYLCCAALCRELLAACYRLEGMEPPPEGELFSRLPETRLGREFLPNLEAYLRVCIRLDGVRPGRSAAQFPQYTDAERLICRMRDF